MVWSRHRWRWDDYRPGSKTLQLHISGAFRKTDEWRLADQQPFLASTFAGEARKQIGSAVYQEHSRPWSRQILKSRAIAQDLANRYCFEVDFKIGTKTYNAIGFPNRSGGYELRNPWFKGSSSPKDISLISGNSSSKLSVFEGFIDFLSALTISNPKFTEAVQDSGFLVLNSLAFVSREIPLLRSFSEIKLFLDNDNAGRDAKNKLQNQGIRFQDASAWYSKHKDVNEYLLSSELVKQKNALHPRPRSRLRRWKFAQ